MDGFYVAKIRKISNTIMDEDERVAKATGKNGQQVRQENAKRKVPENVRNLMIFLFIFLGWKETISEQTKV
jgi:hypothetical protein